jgi:hypothetical protein
VEGTELEITNCRTLQILENYAIFLIMHPHFSLKYHHSVWISFMNSEQLWNKNHMSYFIHSLHKWMHNKEATSVQLQNYWTHFWWNFLFEVYTRHHRLYFGLYWFNITSNWNIGLFSHKWYTVRKIMRYKYNHKFNSKRLNFVC